MLYGSVLSMIFAIDATFVVGMLLYDANIFVSEPRQAGELFPFSLTALIGAKYTAELAGQPGTVLLRRERPLRASNGYPGISELCPLWLRRRSHTSIWSSALQR